MFTDIVFPKDNEKKIINMAVRLGYSKLYLVYNSKADLKKIKELQKDTDIKIKIGIKTDIKNINKLKNKICLTLIEANDKIRYIIEKIKPNVIYNLELVGRKDFIHHRNSGLNQVLCKLANKNKIIVGLNFNNFLKETKLRTDIVLGRIQQNIKLCRKYKVKTLIASFASSPYEMRNPQDLLSFAIILGQHPKEAKDSLNY